MKVSFREVILPGLCWIQVKVWIQEQRLMQKTTASYITQDAKIYQLHYFNQPTDLNIFSWLVGFKFCESFRLSFQLAGD